MRPPGTSRPMPSSGIIAADARAVPNASARRAPAQRAPEVARRLEALPQPLRERRARPRPGRGSRARWATRRRRRGTEAVITGPGGRVERSDRRRRRKSSRSPLPEKPRPQARAQPGRARRGCAAAAPVDAERPGGEHDAVGAHLALGLRDGVEQVLGMAGARGQVLAVARRASRRPRESSARRLAAAAHLRARVDARRSGR